MSERRSLFFEGEVDAYGFDSDWLRVSPTIAGRNVVEEIEETWPSMGPGCYPQVEVVLGVEPVASGDLWAITGFGGTDVTPPEPPEIRVGGFDLIDKLHEYDGETVALLIRDPLPPSEQESEGER